MKKIITVVTLFLFTLVSLVPIRVLGQSNPTKVAIVQLVSHPSLDAINEGITEGLKSMAGGDRLVIDQYNAEGDMNLLNSLAQQAVQSQPDYIFAITTPVAQALQNATEDIPIIMAGITDPVSAKLVNSLEAPGGNISGISDFLDPQVQFDFIHQSLPQVKTIGMIYTTSEDNSKKEIEEAKATAEAMGYTVRVEGMNAALDMPMIAKKLVGQVDLIYIGSDNTVASAFPTLVDITDEAKIPIVTPVAPMIEQGALAGVAINQKDIGTAAVDLLKTMIQEQKPIGQMPVRYIDTYAPIVNQAVAQQLGISLTAAPTSSPTTEETTATSTHPDNAGTTAPAKSTTTTTAPPTVTETATAATKGGNLFDSYLNAIVQGILWGLMGLGLYVTFRILKFADLTSEASFTIGAATSVSLLNQGFHPILAMIAAIILGALAGLLTAALMTYLDLPGLIASIISLTALYSVNLRIMGVPNLSLRGIASVFDVFTLGNKLLSVFILGGGLVLILTGVMTYFFKTDLGQALIATGDNQTMAKSLGIHTITMKTLGLMLANGLIALCGALVSQNNGFADISMGSGTVVIALASIVIGEVLLHQEISLGMRLLSIILGAIIYQLILTLVLQLGFSPNDFKLLSALVLAIFLALPRVKSRMSLKASSGKKATY